MTGKKPQQLNLEEPLRIHELHEEGVGVWMSDLPAELRQMQEALKTLKPKGKLLVGGLGLGIVASLATKIKGVSSVDVVEINQSLRDLVVPSDATYNVITSDIYSYFEAMSPDEFSKYDAVFLDTWQRMNEGGWWEEVMPLKRLIQSKFGAELLFPTAGRKRATRVAYWAEGIMLGQVVRALMTLKSDQQHWFYRMALPMGLPEAVEFVRDVGLPWWEQKWGHLYPEKGMTSPLTQD